jgi:hypothetical protein
MSLIQSSRLTGRGVHAPEADPLLLGGTALIRLDVDGDLARARTEPYLASPPRLLIRELAKAGIADTSMFPPEAI